MSPRRLLRHFDPQSDEGFVRYADALLDRVAARDAAPWPSPEDELRTIARFERYLRRRFPFAAVEIVGQSGPSGYAAGVRVYRDGGRSQSAW